MKEYRKTEIKYLFTIYILLFLCWCTDFSSILKSSINDNFINLLLLVDPCLIVGIISLFAFILDSLISPDFKDKLVKLFFIKMRNGETFFSRLEAGKVKDNRFLNTEAKKRYKLILKAMPKDEEKLKKYENAKWYEIYSKYREVGSVKQSEKDYLLCRDLYVDTLLFLCIFLLTYGYSNFTGITVYFSLQFVILLVINAIFLSIATRQKTNRFINTVIAIDIATNKKEEKSK